MLKLGSKPNAVGTAVPCPTCGHPNLGINIWCERCRTPLEWTGQKLAAKPDVRSRRGARRARARARPPRASAAPQLSMPAIPWPRLTVPAIAWPRLTMPTPALPRLRMPRVPRIAWVVAAIVAILLIAPLAYVLLPSGRTAAARPGALGHLPATNGATAGETLQAAAIQGVEAKTSLPYSPGKCATNSACLTIASQTLGENAAAVVFSTAGSGGRQCAGYVYRSGGRWNFLDAVCGLPGQLSPLVGHNATVHVPGNCANVRSAASLTAGVVACLRDGAVVLIDGGPTYADGRLWWHEKHGWMAHDFLTGP